MIRPLRQLAENLWVADRPQTFYGLPVGTRMTVIRLAEGRLLLHSPVALDAQLKGELDSLGRVSFAVAPGWLRSEQMLENYGVSEAREVQDRGKPADATGYRRDWTRPAKRE